VSTLGTMAVLSPLWMPSWISRVRSLPQFVVNHPILSSMGAGGAYAGFMRLSDPESNLVRDFGIGTSAGMAFLAPAWAPRIPVAGSWIVRGSRSTGSLFHRLGTFAGGLAACLQAGGDSAGGYDTHFWQDLRSSTVAMGIGLTASSVLAAAVRRALLKPVKLAGRNRVVQ